MAQRARDRQELAHDTRKTVFLVDRSDSFIMYLRILLERMGFRVVPLKKGRLLRELLPIVRPDLVLLGTVSEGTDPAEVLRDLPTEEGKPPVPVVLITQKDEDEIGFDPREAGFAGSLGRPVNIFRLFKVVYDQIVFSSGEKRLHLRTPFHEKVTVHRHGRAAAYRAISLSEGGLFIRTGEAMDSGEALLVELPLGFGAPETLPGEVIYRKESREDEPAAETGVAVRFTAVTQEQAARLTVAILGLLVGDILEDQEEPVLSLVSQTNTLYEDIVREHIRLGQELRSAELHLKTVVDALPTGMLTYRIAAGGALELLSANPAAERIFAAGGGRSRTRARKGPDWERIGIAAELRRVAGDGGTFQVSGLPWRDGKSERFLDVLAFQARPGTAAVLVGDVTRRTRAEAEQLRLQKLESLGLLAGGIAHDFNNLLQGISGSVEVARGLLGDGEQDCPSQRIGRVLYLLGQADAGVARASKLSRQLLTFAKGGEPVMRTIALGPVISEALEMALPGAGVRSRVELAEGLPAVRGDADQLHQVFTNLAVNALQALPQGGEVSVTAKSVEVGPGHPSLAPGPYVLVTVRDTGAGIPGEILPSVFDPYFTTKQEGSGLGLSTALAIVHKHGGWIDLESEPGRGTTVAVHLPAVPAGAPAASREEEREPWKGSGKVLVMDDERLLWPGLQGMLESLGFSSVFTADGEEMLAAYAKARRARKPFDAVILDLTVRSGMGGQEAARRLLELDAGACAIVSSGYSNAPILASHAEFGFRAALAKPYTLGALARALEEAVG